MKQGGGGGEGSEEDVGLSGFGVSGRKETGICPTIRWNCFGENLARLALERDGHFHREIHI